MTSKAFKDELQKSFQIIFDFLQYFGALAFAVGATIYTTKTLHVPSTVKLVLLLAMVVFTVGATLLGFVKLWLVDLPELEKIGSKSHRTIAHVLLFLMFVFLIWIAFGAVNAAIHQSNI